MYHSARHGMAYQSAILIAGAQYTHTHTGAYKKCTIYSRNSAIFFLPNVGQYGQNRERSQRLAKPVGPRPLPPRTQQIHENQIPVYANKWRDRQKQARAKLSEIGQCIRNDVFGACAVFFLLEIGWGQFPSNFQHGLGCWIFNATQNHLTDVNSFVFPFSHLTRVVCTCKITNLHILRNGVCLYLDEAQTL